MGLTELKKSYSELAKKYSLPSFSEMNEDFEIDKIDKESETLIRVVRKHAMDKLVNSMTFLEMLVNPVNTPRIYFPYIKSMSTDDRKSIEEMYGMLGDVSIASLSLELGYSEKKEAEFVKKMFSTWQVLKPKFSKLMEHMQETHSSEPKKEKSYFG